MWKLYTVSRKGPFSIALILSMLIARPAHAQITPGFNRDSVWHLLATRPDDTLKVPVLILLGQQYEYNQPDSALYYYDRAGQLSRQLHYPAGYIRYVSNYASVLNTRGKFDESIRLNLQAVDTCLKYRLGGLNYIRAFGNTATAYQYKGDYAAAVDYYLKTLPVAEGMGDAGTLSTLYNNLSGLYRDLQQPEKALGYSQKSLDLAEKTHDLNLEGNARINLGNLQKDFNQMSGGLHNIERALSIARQLHDSVMEETALVNIGDTYEKMHDPARSITAFQKALPIAAALKDVPGQAHISQGLAIGLFQTARYPAAQSLLLKAIAFDSAHGEKKMWRDALLLMSDVQIALGHPDLSRQYRDQYDSVSEAYLNASLLTNIQELETKYKVEKQQHDLLKKDVQLKEKDKAAIRQRAWLITAIIVACLLTILFILTWRFSRQRQQLQQRAIRALEAEQENVRLKAKLEGQQHERQRISQEMHDDMGSGLTSLLFLGRSLKPPDDQGSAITHKIQQTAEGLIHKMNEIIWTMNYEQDTLDSLIAYIRTNAAGMLENAGIDFRYSVQDPLPQMAVNQECRRNLYLVVKEAVHNIVRHSGASSVQIDISVTGSILAITIHDNGKGFDPAAGHRFGNGLKNMARRMQQVGGKMDWAIDNGTRLDLRAPV